MNLYQDKQKTIKISSLLSVFSAFMLSMIFVQTAIAAIPVSEASTEKVSDKNPLEMRDWLALGSGCRGRQGENRKDSKVRAEIHADRRNPMIYHVDFALDSYQLNGDKAVGDKATFARECSLRIAAYPGKNLKISNFSMETSLDVQRDKGSALTLASRIMTAQGSLNEWSFIHEKNSAMQNSTHKISLSPDQHGHKMMSDIPCETPKILGADFRIINERENFRPKVLVKPSGKGKVRMTITLSSCKNPEKPA
ncbi:MAG: hypothetical protein H6618_04770 [Deltaproteobacteria bacterium]|nr:hypothetical protein [Deltaproteobacteria bacterium]